MNSNVKIFLAFVAGMGIGSFTTYEAIRNKYETAIREEIDSLRDHYAKAEKAGEAKEKPSLEEMVKDINKTPAKEVVKAMGEHVAEQLGYIPSETPKHDEDVLIIHPDEFGMEDEYDTTSLTYYEDGVLANELDEKIDDVAELFGDINVADHFGEYEEDSVFIRNNTRKTDYEILLSEKTYAEVLESKPHPDMEG